MILRTKLFVPPLRPSLVPRQRLIARLNQNPHARMTVIAAPAGYGKTTLVTEWIQSQQAVWLSLDSEDNDLDRFVTYVVAALQQVDAAIGAQVIAMQQAEGSDPMQMSTILLNDVSFLDERVLLVLDDFHLIENPQIHEMVAFWLEHLPPQLHLVFISRMELPISLARWRVRQQVCELGTADLRFTQQETAVFLNDLMDLQLTDTDVAALEACTEGWIASLQLAAMSLRQQDAAARTQFVQHFSGSNRFVIDYLVDEILARQRDDVRDFLVDTAVFERFCADLCAAVRGADDSRLLLEQLEKANLFLIPLDERREWFRYHHLFADFLRQRWQQKAPEVQRTARQRAATWFAAQGLLDEAITHALAAEDFATAASLMADFAQDLLVRGEIKKILHRVSVLPEAAQKENPRLVLFTAWALLFAGQMEAVAQMLPELAQMSDGPNWPMSAYVTMLQGFLATRNGRFAQGIELTEAALAQLGRMALDDDTSAIMVGAGAINLADSYVYDGRIEEAVRQYQTAVALNQETGNILAALGAAKSLADLTIARGQLHTARDILQQGLRMAAFWEQTVPIPGMKILAVAPLYATLGLLYCQWQDVPAAKPLIEEAAERYKLSGAANEAEGLEALAHLYWVEGKVTAVNHCLEQMQELAAKSPFEYTRQRIECAVLTWKIRLMQVDVRRAYYADDAAAWVQAHKVLLSQEIHFVNEFAFFALARALLATGQIDSLLDVLQRLKMSTQSTGRWGDAARVQVLWVLALAQQGNTAVSLEMLSNLLPQTERERYIRLFVDEGEPMAELLRQLPAAPYRNRLLSHFHLAEDTKLPMQDLVEPLSERELEVLHLMAAGATNQHIADTLVIAKSTAKKHVSNIIGKLGAENRTAAIAHARELGLL